QPLSGGGKRRILTALNMIKARWDKNNVLGLSFSDVELAAKFAAFLETNHKSIYAYTCDDLDLPFVIFNRQPLRQDDLELCRTLLHELLHLLNAMGIVALPGRPLTEEERRCDSLLEAKHELLTLHLLGQGVPVQHWALRKYPELAAMIQESREREM